MDKVTAVEDLKVANERINNKTRIWTISKIILVVAKDSLEAGGSQSGQGFQTHQSDIVCHYCGRKGHMQASCYRRQNDMRNG